MDELEIWRNYSLFAILADVRNGRGFAGIRTGDGFNVIGGQRGLPADASAHVKKESERWGQDGHSHSWFTLKELLDFDWNQVTKHTGVVDDITYEQWKKKGGTPRTYSAGVAGPNIKIYTEEGYASLPSRAISIDQYIQISWDEKYGDSCDQFIKQILPKLKDMAKNPEDVRMAFWFDN